MRILLAHDHTVVRRGLKQIPAGGIQQGRVRRNAQCAGDPRFGWEGELGRCDPGHHHAGAKWPGRDARNQKSSAPGFDRVERAMNTTRIAACTTSAAAPCTLHNGQRAGRAALPTAGQTFLRGMGAAAKGRSLPGRQLQGFRSRVRNWRSWSCQGEASLAHQKLKRWHSHEWARTVVQGVEHHQPARAPDPWLA
jgi:hypothetical protein